MGQNHEKSDVTKEKTPETDESAAERRPDGRGHDRLRQWQYTKSGRTGTKQYSQKFPEAEAEIAAGNDSGNVTIKTTRPCVDLTRNLAYPVMVMLDVEHTTDYDHAAIGTGPYVATNFREEVGYTMVANEHYWDGEVPFASIELLFRRPAHSISLEPIKWAAIFSPV